MQKITIAIDGYSSCGKSTLAKSLAHKLGYNYIDTGAMYRAVALYALRHDLFDENKNLNKEEMINVLPLIDVEFELNPTTHNSDVILNGENVEREIRTMEVSDLVSKVSAVKEVREKMVASQRQMGKKKAVVLDGRDIGTEVFPKAELKLFMIADPEVRAKRRQVEFSSKGQYFTIDEVEMSLLKRDMADISREESPLTQAEDAVVLDNSDLSKEEQLEFVLKLIADLHYISREEQSHH
ncbi:(d)CMP kinase [Aurantibacillus circumpalustris]|uniref:(d)CMP kinase n=1 Tax=Aurantibacillus circumpalustris TaxID=3036359 RepID=UPI00295BFC67|nr:(d)CMP kinase [Aurantibacillus circumpalustris]